MRFDPFRPLACVVLLGLAAPTSAATFVVTKTADTSDGSCNADCSLREAVAAAVAAPGNDVITFDPAVFSTPRTITLSGSEIAIASAGSLLIEGPGAQLLTIDGNGASRIISNDAGAVTTIRGIRFTGGNGAGAANTGRGGAIYNNGGTLVLERLVLVGNTANTGGAVNNAGTAASLSIIDCHVQGNASVSSGGAMQNFSGNALFVSGSSFVANTGGGSTGGGAAQLNGEATLVNSTFSGNVASAGSGGAIHSNGPRLLVVNSTFTGNSALSNAGGLHRASSSTTPALFVRNSLIAGNTGGAAPDVSSLGIVTSLGNNLVGVSGGTVGFVASDLLDVAAGLGPLADNGGPTPTHALLAGSPAIDAGQACVLDSSCASDNLASNLTTDQRGRARPGGAGVDIGAYEVSDPRIFGNGFEGP
jgi:CSLREA domain-containing protein